MAIRVKATKKGLYGQVRRPGDVFEINDEKAFSKNWMERLDPPVAAVKADAKVGKSKIAAGVTES